MKQPGAKRAWRKANAYVRFNKHAKAEYWLRQHLIFSMVNGRIGTASKLAISAIFFVGLFVLAVLVVWVGSK
jgi:hypothetical protein